MHGVWVALAVLLLALAWQHRGGLPLSAGLMELAPQARHDATRARAQQQVNAPLAHQMLMLVGHADGRQARAIAQGAARQLHASGVFARVRLEIDIDVAAFAGQLLQARLAMLPAAAREQLLREPLVYLQQRAEEIANPFGDAGSVPLGSDLLGLTRQIEHALRPAGAVHLDLATRTLQARAGELNWVLVLADARHSSLDQSSDGAVAAAVADARQAVLTDGGQFLAAGGALYAAAGSAQAKQESLYIGLVSLAGIVLVLLGALRRLRALLAFLPVLVGMLAGAAACIAVFGQLHVLTMVVGMSLLGVAIDFPMHWLGKSYGVADWQAWRAMRSVRPGLTLSLATTLLGYVALALTPFPALRQTAVFSVAGLAAAYACTVFVLPALFQGWRPRPRPSLARHAGRIVALAARARRMPRWVQLLALAAGLFACLAGMSRLDLHDDLRHWVGVPPELTREAAQIGAITGLTPTSQFFLVRAPDTDELLRRQARLTRQLDVLIDDQRLHGYDALSDVAAPTRTQALLKTRMAALAESPQALQVLERIGVPGAALIAELQALASLPTQGLSEVLASAPAERWRSLFLGQVDAQVAGLVTLRGLASASGLDAIAAQVPGVEFVDGAGDLNRLFAATRLEAAELKLESYLIAALLLWMLWGRKATLRILLVPLAASACTLAALGFAGQPLTLFSLFGLLLVSALGVDYAIFMYEGIGGTVACLVGVGLGAATTLLSFGMLALSATPAIASFGLSVAVGVFFSVVFAACAGTRPTPSLPASAQRSPSIPLVDHGNP